MIYKTIKDEHLDMSNTKAKETIWILFFILKKDTFLDMLYMHFSSLRAIHMNILSSWILFACYFSLINNSFKGFYLYDFCPFNFLCFCNSF